MKRFRCTAKRSITCVRLVIPSTKQMESRMLDLPDPFRPVIALNCGSKPGMTTLCAYDLNPSTVISFTCILITNYHYRACYKLKSLNCSFWGRLSVSKVAIYVRLGSLIQFMLVEMKAQTDVAMLVLALLNWQRYAMASTLSTIA